MHLVSSCAFIHIALGVAASHPDTDAMAVALLRGAELARMRHDSLRATVELRWTFSPDDIKTARCEIEMSGNLLRCEVFPGRGGFDAAVVIRDGDEFRGFRRRKHSDLEVFSLEHAIRGRVDVTFDPRVLGLSDLMSVGTTVRHTLRHDEYEDMSVVGKETVRGVETWRVRANDRGTTFEFWIEEPSFRVHKKTARWGDTVVEINSEFTSPEIPSPFPSRVVALRTSPDSKEERTYVVKKLELGVTIPSDRFTLNSMALPVNTPVNDYRISRIVGYWDGEKVVPRPVSLATSPKADKTPPNRYLLRAGIGFGILAVMVCIVWLFQRRVGCGN